MTPINGQHTESRVALDDLFDALAEETRRGVLLALAKESPRWDEEFLTQGGRPGETDRENVAIELHHKHLPKLDQAGFIDYDEASGRITRGAGFEEVHPLLRSLEDYAQAHPGDSP